MSSSMQAVPRSRLALRAAATLSLAALVVTGLAACDHPRVDDEFHPRLTEHSRRHPVTVVAETATLDLSLGDHGKGGDGRAYIETTRFMRNFGQEGRGPMTIAVPRGAGSRASRHVQSVRLAAHRAGIPSQRLRVVTKPGPADTVTLAYDRIAAIGPTCGNWTADAARPRDGIPYENWGCASQRNIAAMAAHPTDLMFPARETPRGSETREKDRKNFDTRLGKPQDLPSR